MFVAVELKGMSGVGTALETSHYIVFGGEDIDNLAFAFVAPLQAKKNIGFHLSVCFFDDEFTFLVPAFALRAHAEHTPWTVSENCAGVNAE